MTITTTTNNQHPAAPAIEVITIIIIIIIHRWKGMFESYDRSDKYSTVYVQYIMYVESILFANTHILPQPLPIHPSTVTSLHVLSHQLERVLRLSV